MAASPGRQRLARALGRRGLIAALLASAGVFAVLLVQGFLTTSLQSSVSFGRFGFGFGSDAPDLWGTILANSLLTWLPFAIGMFLMLWQIAPIGPDLRFAHVVTRSILAGAGGVLVVVFVVVIVSAVTTVAHLPGVFFGGVDPSAEAQAFGIEVADGILTGLRTLILELPLVVLAGLLLWGWQQRRPEAHDVAGAVDEV